jgi:hypothetical protein
MSKKEFLNYTPIKKVTDHSDKKETGTAATSKVSSVDNKLYLEIYMPCMI